MKRTAWIIAALVLAALLIYLVISKPGHKGTNSRTKKTGMEPPFLVEARVHVLASDARDTLSTVYATVADDPYERARGLMYRYHLPDSVGMYFIFESMDHQSFWMKNTHIPLDIIFADDAHRIVFIEEFAVPYTEDMIPSRKRSRFVLEVNAGHVQEHGISEGDCIAVEPLQEPVRIRQVQ
ncbi:MAG: DUF192 domain-containing protein [Bacteroidales bacterium]